MVNLNLAPDEGILLEEHELVWVVTEEEDLDALVLTNKNLYLVHTKMNGLFSKSTTEIITHPFSDIKVINDAPLIDVVDDNDYGLSLQIQFIEGRQLFICSEDENTIKWYQTLYKTVTGQDAPNEYQVPTKATKGIGAAFASGLGGLTANIANATATASQSLAAKVQEATTQVAASFESFKIKKLLNNKINNCTSRLIQLSQVAAFVLIAEDKYPLVLNSVNRAEIQLAQQIKTAKLRHQFQQQLLVIQKLEDKNLLEQY